MTSESDIDPATIQAYRETEYHVHGSHPMKIRVDEPCADLADLHKLHRVNSSAFITACNPFSLALDDAGNAERQATLAHELRLRSLTFFEGTGQHRSNDWPGDPSFLVLGLTLEAAKRLGARLEQNAIVWIGPNAVPQLILLR